MSIDVTKKKNYVIFMILKYSLQNIFSNVLLRPNSEGFL